MIKQYAHKLYVALGMLLNNIRLVYWRVRDKVSPPKEKTVLFVAHPDDDTLFFHRFIKEHKPYVVLLTTGWSLRRYPCFKKVMKYYGVKYRAYNLHSRDKRSSLLKSYISEVLTLINPNTCLTHNAEGEYGHEMHRRVHLAVKELYKGELLVPALDKDIECFPLEKNLIDEKIMIFNKYYTTELFVLDEYKKWVINEKLVVEE